MSLDEVNVSCPSQAFNTDIASVLHLLVFFGFCLVLSGMSFSNNVLIVIIL